MTKKATKNPTYFQHVRHFFDDKDYQCMFPRGWDFTTFEKLKENASDVYLATEPPDASMPKGKKKWSKARSETFFNWMENGYKLGNPTFKKPRVSTASRIRKNAKDVKGQELKDLQKAFSEIK